MWVIPPEQVRAGTEDGENSERVDRSLRSGASSGTRTPNPLIKVSCSALELMTPAGCRSRPVLTVLLDNDANSIRPRGWPRPRTAPSTPEECPGDCPADGQDLPWGANCLVHSQGPVLEVSVASGRPMCASACRPAARSCYRWQEKRFSCHRWQDRPTHPPGPHEADNVFATGYGRSRSRHWQQETSPQAESGPANLAGHHRTR